LGHKIALGALLIAIGFGLCALSLRVRDPYRLDPFAFLILVFGGVVSAFGLFVMVGY
jgi:hypothetical protein